MINKKHNIFSIVGFTLSIVSLIYSLIYVLITEFNIIYLPLLIILSISSLVFSIIGLSRPNYKKLLSIIGIIISTIIVAAILGSVIVIIVFIALY